MANSPSLCTARLGAASCPRGGPAPSDKKARRVETAGSYAILPLGHKGDPRLLVMLLAGSQGTLGKQTQPRELEPITGDQEPDQNLSRGELGAAIAYILGVSIMTGIICRRAN